MARPENFRVARVLRARRVTPHMQRVTLQVDDLSRFDCSPRALGPHVHALIPRPDCAEPGWPTVDEKGHAVYPPPEKRPAVRTYSVRRFDHAENSMDVDFVLHGDGVASAWAERALPGEEIGLWRPHARVLDEEPERYVLAGDHTALPAIGFILDHLPEEAQGEVIVMVPCAAEEQPLRLPNGMRLRWLHATPEAQGGNALTAAVRGLDPRAVRASFVWVGAEAAAARDIRAFARKECGLPASSTYILNYWKRGMVEGTYDHGE
ncbi:Siderophore-interacting protein [Nitratireductor pacificus pht-3B]|uniref:Siderophore-interacting protein n=1 Tax=Nitratireductor pacificus pht-3B TaxID=391937 RepID=K2MIK1_9HYPH|nr:Siderophore-interacting protein [Nitratireductor pacificus pht-3B]